MRGLLPESVEPRVLLLVIQVRVLSGLMVGFVMVVMVSLIRSVLQAELTHHDTVPLLRHLRLPLQLHQVEMLVVMLFFLLLVQLHQVEHLDGGSGKLPRVFSKLVNCN